MKKLFFRIIFWSFLFIAFISLFLTSYGFYLISELNKKGGFQLNAISQGRDLKTEIISLELSSFVHLKDIEALYPFLNESVLFKNDFTEWKKESMEEGNFAPIQELDHSPIVQINTPIDLSLSMINDCERVYCYQRKMNFSDIPSSLWRGLIGIEDSRFLEHKGVDLRALFRALIADLRAMNLVQGGSTLTQQLVKNLFFTNEKTLSRKLKEMLLSIYIESKYEKEEILQAYFNEVIWGSLAGVRIKGAYGASLFYFSKKPAKLTDFESSILSALLKGPYFYHPLNNLEGLKERTILVYNKLKSDNFISLDDKSEWSLARWNQWKKELEVKNKDHRYKAIAESLQGKDFYQQYIWSTIIGERLSNLKERKNLEGSDLATKVYIRDLVSCPKVDESCDDFIYYSKKERDELIAITEEKNQVGSILKPLVYQILFRNGFKKFDEVTLGPIELDLISGKWSPKESKVYDESKLTLEEALQKSRNIPVIRLSKTYGFEKLEEELDFYLPQMKKPLGEYPSQLLGSVELSVEEVANLYHKFIKKECELIENGNQDNEDSVLFMLSNPQLTTIKNHLNPLMQTFQFFGKTGTSNYAHDNWFIGFNGRQIVTIWTGLEGVRDQNSLQVSGASTSYKIYESYWLRSGKTSPEFGCPESLIELTNEEQ